LKKIITKKNHVGEHCSNPHCFKEKNYEAKFSTSSIYKKIKLTKTIMEKKKKKIIKKEKKHVEKHCSNLQCFKEKKL
jgi:glutaminase